MFKIKIIYALAGMIILLVLTDILVTISKSSDEEIVKPIFTTTQIESGFLKVLERHGIKKDWINKRAISDSKNDSLKFSHRIKIPSSVSLPVLITEVNKQFSGTPVSVTATEMTINGRTILKISSGEFVKLQASLNYDDALRRDSFSLAFIINGIERIEKTEREILFNLPFPITFAIREPGNADGLITEMEDFNKKFVIVVKEENGADKYKLDPGYQRSQLRNSIINMVKDFEKAPVFLYEHNSDLNRSTIFNFVKDEFKKRGRILRNLSDYISLTGDNIDDRISLLRFHCSSFTPGEIKIFTADAESFIQIVHELWEVKNKGNNFIGLDQVY